MIWFTHYTPPHPHPVAHTHITHRHMFHQCLAWGLAVAGSTVQVMELWLIALLHPAGNECRPLLIQLECALMCACGSRRSLPVDTLSLAVCVLHMWAVHVCVLELKFHHWKWGKKLDKIARYPDIGRFWVNERWGQFNSYSGGTLVQAGGHMQSSLLCWLCVVMMVCVWWWWWWGVTTEHQIIHIGPHVETHAHQNTSSETSASVVFPKGLISLYPLYKFLFFFLHLYFGSTHSLSPAVIKAEKHEQILSFCSWRLTTKTRKISSSPGTQRLENLQELENLQSMQKCNA